MNRQEAFDINWNHFVVNKGKPSITSSMGMPVCAYRGRNGAKCAIGLLIPDTEYDKELECESATGIARHISTLRRMNTDFLKDLQTTHDDATDSNRDTHLPFMPARLPEFHAQIEIGLRALAKEYRLKVPA